MMENINRKLIRDLHVRGFTYLAPCGGASEDIRSLNEKFDTQYDGFLMGDEEIWGFYGEARAYKFAEQVTR